MKSVGIIGGGIIGLCSAYYLSKRGYQVTVIDSGGELENCSHGNAGMIVPSHIFPMAAPGMIAKGIRWMFDSQSPFYVKPRLNGDLIKWGLKFYSHSTKKHVEYSIPLLKEISLLSKSLYQKLHQENLFDFGYHERGLMILYQTKEVEVEEIEAAHIARRAGLDVHVLDLPEIQKLEPEVRVEAKGGIFYPGDCHVTPHLLMKNLLAHLKETGVTFMSNTTVDYIGTMHGSIIGLKAGNEKFLFDEYVLAGGAWSGLIGAKLGIDIPMQGGKGYSFNIHDLKYNLRIPTLLIEGRVAVTPMGNSLRFGGTMEINGTDRSVNMNRVKGIVNTIPKYYPDLQVDMPARESVWSGLRPCSPDGLPYIGRSKSFNNFTIATGHSMMGLSLGPATGLLVSELVSETKTSMDITAFDPERFS